MSCLCHSILWSKVTVEAAKKNKCRIEMAMHEVDSHSSIMTGFTITDKMTTLLLSYKRDSLARHEIDFRRYDFSVFHKLVATQAHWKNVTWWYFGYYVVWYMFCNTFKSKMSSVCGTFIFPPKQIKVNLAWFYCVGCSKWQWQLGDEMPGERH